MTLSELLQRFACRPATSVPDWMLGYFRRRSISFADGTTDLKTHVCWFQSRNFTIDLRLPAEPPAVTGKPLSDLNPEELQLLANHEGWEALCDWQGETLRWHTDTSLQVNNRWPEPGILKRIGNCMIEFSPSDAYVEEWRLQPSYPGPLIGLRLVEEREVLSGVVRHRGGGLIVCGEYAALVLGRANPLDGLNETSTFRSLVAQAQHDPRRLQHLFNFETSVAQGSLERGFDITLSTDPTRVRQSLVALDGFDYQVSTDQVIQRFKVGDIECERLFAVDTLEMNVPFESSTGFSPAAEQWYERESPTLKRYTHIVS